MNNSQFSISIRLFEKLTFSTAATLPKQRRANYRNFSVRELQKHPPERSARVVVNYSTAEGQLGSVCGSVSHHPAQRKFCARSSELTSRSLALHKRLTL